MIVEGAIQIRYDRFIQAQAEAGIALRLGSDLSGPGISLAQALAATDGVLAAIEIGDSRIAGADGETTSNSVADNSSAARLVAGGRVTPVSGLDLLHLVGVLFYRNGVPMDRGAGAAALGHPARCVAWLANKLSAQGERGSQDVIVLSGALHRMVPVRPRLTSSGRSSHHLGAVSAHFSERDAA